MFETIFAIRPTFCKKWTLKAMTIDWSSSACPSMSRNKSTLPLCPNYSIVNSDEKCDLCELCRNKLRDRWYVHMYMHTRLEQKRKVRVHVYGTCGPYVSSYLSLYTFLLHAAYGAAWIDPLFEGNGKVILPALRAIHSRFQSAKTFERCFLWEQEVGSVQNIHTGPSMVLRYAEECVDVLRYLEVKSSAQHEM